MPESEIEKIALFVEEAKKLWRQNPVFVTSEQFFRLWQENCLPESFLLPSEGICLCGKTIFRNLEIDDVQAVVSVDWDAVELCPRICCELEREMRTVLICIADDGIRLETGPTLENPLEETLHGEHVEAMFEAVQVVKEHYPDLNLANVTDVVLKEALEELAAKTGDKLYHQISSNSFGRKEDRRRLLQRVLSDMSEDELSPQLTLGLTVEEKTAEVPSDDVAEAIPPSQLPARGIWELRQDMALLEEAEKERLKSEDSFFFNFSVHEALAPLDGCRQMVRVTFPHETLSSLREGARFVLFPEGSPRLLLGTFTIDLLEGDDLLGTIQWNSPDDIVPLDEKLFAMPRRSPQEFIVRSMEVFLKTVFDETLQSLTALRATLGLIPMSYLFPPPKRDAAFPRLDEWQACAVKSCLDDTNPVIMVQGPPGTGKTSVLETVVRKLVAEGRRILVTAPSNTAVDNICKRIKDLPLLRHASQKESVATEIADRFWGGIEENCTRFAQAATASGAEVHASTHVGLLRSTMLADDVRERGPFDVIIFDEAGMSRTAEALLCLCMAKRAFFFGDPQQLPPFPLPESAMKLIRERHPALTHSQQMFINSGLLTWMQAARRFPAILLRTCYRCQNPRLMRFASLLFYNAQVKTDASAEYFRLSYRERQQKYPPASLTFYSTSSLSAALRHEQLVLDGFQPGYANPAEALIAVKLVLDAMKKYPLSEITVISPYRKQIKLIRELLKGAPHDGIDEEVWNVFRHERVATVDSFQGGESDFVVISYVRSGGHSVGFVDDPNRINVTHTRSRREMCVIGDLTFLKAQAESRIFMRMARRFERDGVISAIHPSTFTKTYLPLATLVTPPLLSTQEEMNPSETTKEKKSTADNQKNTSEQLTLF